MKPKLLIVELWGIGDSAIATPFIQAACEKYDVTLLAKPFALELQPRFWPKVKVVPFRAPWTAFGGKYKLWRWPWLTMLRLLKQLHGNRYDFAASARWDPRDHFLMWLIGAQKRFGFARLQSHRVLTRAVPLPHPTDHRYEHWRRIAKALEVDIPEKKQLQFSETRNTNQVLVHTGAARPVRVWPLVRFRNLVAFLRSSGHQVQVACDPDQRGWWLDSGEEAVVTPTTLTHLINVIESSAAFVGNDSGPGHLAAISGCPTLTIFGPQLPEWFLPLHQKSEFIEGKACPYKPCFDYCRFPAPHCLLNVSEAEVFDRAYHFLAEHVRPVSSKTDELPAGLLNLSKQP
jgi:ADP-heptose:LPS heptosyltransferase